jgi:hypothetical protein
MSNERKFLVTNAAGQRVVVEADDAYADEWLTLVKAGKIVGALTPYGSIYQVDLAVDAPGVGPEKLAREIRPAVEKVLPSALEVAAEAVSFNVHPAPLWPAVAGGAFGFIVGVGLALSCAGGW